MQDLQANNNKRDFIIFLIINLILWSCVQLLRNIISLDSMEAISWGELISFGTNKHPPLSGWLMAAMYNLFGHWNFIVYLFGQICILVGFIYTYKLAKFFLSEEKAFCSVMILEACYYYTYYIYINSYNCNVLLMGLWPIIIYYFYKSVKFNNTKDWILYGLTIGLGFLAKYQTIFLFIAMALYLILANREAFKKKGLYISACVAFLTVLPHIIWLFANDFFSFAYMLGRTQADSNNLPLIVAKFSHIFYPIKFIVGQFLALAASIGLYLIIAIQAKNIQFKNNEANKFDKTFLLYMFLAPIIAQGLMGFITGHRIPSIWGSVMVGIGGIILFYFFPIKFKENSFSCFLKWAYASMAISFVVVFAFAILNTQPFLAYPHKQIMTDFDKLWNEQTNNAQLKYVGGDMGQAFQFRHYNKKRPQVILETFGHKNPWVNHQDILNSGILVVAENKEDTVVRARDLVYLLPKDYELTVQTYSYQVCNKINKCEPNEIYYVIIPPLNKN